MTPPFAAVPILAEPTPFPKRDKTVSVLGMGCERLAKRVIIEF